jgi:hypothetical protein
VIVSAANGFSSQPGRTFTIQYLAGLVSAKPAFYSFVDANRVTDWACGTVGLI